MIGPLFRRNVSHHVRLLVALALGLALVEILVVLAAAQIELGPGLMRLLEQFIPVAAREIVFTQLGLATFAGAVAFGFQHPALLAAAVSFVVVVATIPAGERETGFLDLVLSRAVRRETYVASAGLLVAVGAVLLPVSTLAGAAIGLAVVDVKGELPWTRYALPAVGFGLLLLAIGSGALALAAGSARRGTAAARTVGIVLGLFVVEFLADLWKPLATIRWASPFHYFKPVPIALSGELPWRHAAVLVGAAAACAAIALCRFRRQDL